MKIELGQFSESSLLDLATVLSMNDAAWKGQLVALGEAVAVVLAGIRSELVRRWRSEIGPPVAIAFPNLSAAAQTEVARGFMTFQELFRGRLRSEGTPARPFFEESLRLAQTLVLAAFPTNELRN